MKINALVLSSFLVFTATATRAHALVISNTDAFQYTNLTFDGGTGTISGGGSNNAADGMFGGLGMAPIEPGTTIFSDFVQRNSVLDNRLVNTLQFTTNTPTTLAGINLFLAADNGTTLPRGAKNFDLIADTNGIPGFQATDDHVFSTLTYDANGRVELFVPFSTTASHFSFEAEPYFNTSANQYLGVRVWELDAVSVPEPATLALVGLAAPLLLRRRR